MGCAQAAPVLGTVGCWSPHPGEGEQLPGAEVLHSQDSRLSQLSWSQTDAPVQTHMATHPQTGQESGWLSTSKPSPLGA